VAEIRALVLDYGGVLTAPLHDAAHVSGHDDDPIDPESFRSVMREWLGSRADLAAGNPAQLLERGEMDLADFERALAPRLRTRGGRPVAAEGLFARLFAGRGSGPTGHAPMVEAVRRARAAGLKTALLSNSWGMDYDRAGWEALFDAVVISGEVRMRKPEPQIYLHTARALGVAPQACVFVDDTGPNVKGAVAVGMIGVRHVSAEQTLDELEALLGFPLRDAVA
jgi:epoxide hydrolase-like predicted phosphatase